MISSLAVRAKGSVPRMTCHQWPGIALVHVKRSSGSPRRRRRQNRRRKEFGPRLCKSVTATTIMRTPVIRKVVASMAVKVTSSVRVASQRMTALDSRSVRESRVRWGARAAPTPGGHLLHRVRLHQLLRHLHRDCANRLQDALCALSICTLSIRMATVWLQPFRRLQPMAGVVCVLEHAVRAGAGSQCIVQNA